jgi:hypothetical protein
MTYKIESPPDYATPSQDQLDELPLQLARELEWNRDTPHYQTDDEIHAAVAAGTLTEFINSPDLARVKRYIKDGWGFTPFLSASAHQAADLFAMEWRETLEQRFGLIVPEVRLAITSMVRAQDYQEALVESGRLAWPESTHPTGNTFDVDNSGYYVVGDDGDLWSAIDPHRKTTVTKRFEGYDPRITQAAFHAAQVLHSLGIINLVPEFMGTPNAGLHISARPDLAEAVD